MGEKFIQNSGMEDLKGKYYLEDLDVDGKIILEWILVKYGRWLCTGCILLTVGTSDRLL
jgi:hypothetical protein